MTRERLQDIDRAKGLAIFLVVLGHLTLASRPADIAWYLFLETVIYKFHMPFFMFVSGFVFYYSLPQIKTVKDFFIYIKRKFVRLMPAFFLFSILITAGKALFDHFFFVDNVPANVLDGIINILLIPIHSSGKSLWYVYVLFLYHIIFPPLVMVFSKRLYLLVLLGVVIHLCHIFRIILPTTDYFALNHIKQYFLSFSLGIYIVSNREIYFKLIDKYRFTLMIMFIGSFFLLIFDANLSHDFGPSISKLIIGLLSIPAIHSLIRSSLFDNSSVLLLLGKYTFSIYLMNTIAIGLTKAVMVKFIAWNGQNFLFLAPILLLCGLLIPIVLKRYILPKIPALDFITN